MYKKLKTNLKSFVLYFFQMTQLKLLKIEKNI